MYNLVRGREVLRFNDMRGLCCTGILRQRVTIHSRSRSLKGNRPELHPGRDDTAFLAAGRPMVVVYGPRNTAVAESLCRCATPDGMVRQGVRKLESSVFDRDGVLMDKAISTGRKSWKLGVEGAGKPWPCSAAWVRHLMRGDQPAVLPGAFYTMSR